MNRVVLMLFATSLACTYARAQVLHTISTRWNDSFVEWELFSLPTQDAEETEEYKSGEIKQRWLQIREDWSEWEFETDSMRGTIRAKWKDNPSEWELRTYDGDIITLRPVFPRDFTQWRVTDNTIALEIKSKYTSQLDEWLVQDSGHGTFYMYTLRARDPRDWAIEDHLDEKVGYATKLALIFITVYCASPRM